MFPIRLYIDTNITDTRGNMETSESRLASLIGWSVDASNADVWRQQVLQEEQADDVLDGGVRRNDHMAIVYRIASPLETSIEENIADEHVASKRQGKAMLLVEVGRPTSTLVDHRLKS